MKNLILLTVFRVLFLLAIPALLLVAGVKSAMKIIKGIKESLNHSSGWRVYHLEKFFKLRSTQNHLYFLGLLMVITLLPLMGVVVAAIYFNNMSWIAYRMIRAQLISLGVDPNSPNKEEIIAKTKAGIEAALGEADFEKDGVMFYSSRRAVSALGNLSGGAFYFPHDGKIRISAKCGPEVLAHEEGHRFFKHSELNTFNVFDMISNEVMADLYSWWKLGNPAMKGFLYKTLFGFSLFREADDVWFHSLRVLVFHALAPEVDKNAKFSLKDYAGENSVLVKALEALETGEYATYSLDD